MLKNMCLTEGIVSMFKGNGVNCLRIAPFQAIEFYSYEFYKQKLSKILQNMNIQTTTNTNTINYLVCGALAGVTATSIVYPLDLTKTILAI